MEREKETLDIFSAVVHMQEVLGLLSLGRE